MHPLAILLLCLPLQVTSVSPSEGSCGTQLAIDGEGFGAKAPAVSLVDPSTGKKTKLKVTSFSDTHVEAVLKKAAKAGLRDLRLVPKGGAPMLLAGAFDLRAPEPLAVDSPVTFPGDQRTVTGSFFGTKKGKLKVGGAKAKVVSWADDAIAFVVPKKAAGGMRDVLVANKAGEGELALSLLVQGGPLDEGPDVLIVRVGGELLSATDPWQVLGLEGGGLHVAAGLGQGRSLHIRLPVDLATQPLPLSVVNDPAGHVGFLDGAPWVDLDATQWSTAGQGDSYEVSLFEGGAHRVVGAVSATLQRVSGAGEPQQLPVEDGLFVLTLPNAP